MQPETGHHDPAAIPAADFPTPNDHSAFVAAAASRRWPFLFRFVVLLFALFSIGGWVRMIYAIIAWDWLVYVGVWPGPFYLVVTGALWGIAGTLVVIWLWLRRPWGRLAGISVAVFFALSYWIDRLLVLRLDPGAKNTLFAAIVTILALAYTALALRPQEEYQLLRKKDWHVKSRTRN